ncbi:MAG TPA: hypothetical protein VF529_11230 [Solirubrobacteraceae bacterium]
MRVLFSPDTAPALKLIEEIPSGRAIWLEGRNAIGKSVAVRLLDLISGDQPYVDDAPAWRSLRESIGATEVQLTDIRPSGRTLRVVFTPEHWPDLPEVPGDRLGRFTLGDETLAAADVGDLLEVAHIHGAERLEGIIGRERRALGTAVRIVASRLPDRNEFVIELAALAQLIKHASPQHHEDLVAERAQLSEKLEELQSELDSVRARAEHLQRARTARGLLYGANDVPTLEARRARVEELQAREENAQDEMTDLLASLEADQEARVEIDKQRRARMQAAERIAKRVAHLSSSSAAEQLDITPADAEAADALRAAAEDRVRVLKRELTERLSTAGLGEPAARQTFDGVEAALQEAIGSDLGRMALLRTPDEMTVDVSTSLTWLRAQRQFTEEFSRNGATGEIERLRATLNDYEDVAATSRLLARDYRVVDGSARRLQALERSLVAPAGAAERLDDLRRELSALTRELQTARFELGQAAALLGVVGEVTRDTASSVFSAELEAAKSSEDRLDAEYADTTSAAESLSGRVASVLAERLRVDAALAAHVDAVTDLVRMRAAGDVPWLSGWLTDDYTLDQNTTAPPELNALARVASRAVEQFNALYDVLGALTYTFARPEVAVADTRSHYEAAVARVLEAAILEQLNAPPIVNELFDGGHVTEVSLVTNSVSWRTPEGDGRERPVSTFSSGDQAFAFTQAQIRTATQASHENCLVVLDEFGAFVAADRRRRLAELLDEQLTRPGLSAVIIVPLQANYADELDQTTGALKERFERRVREINERGYFTEPFLP